MQPVCLVITCEPYDFDDLLLLALLPLLLHGSQMNAPCQIGNWQLCCMYSSSMGAHVEHPGQGLDEVAIRPSERTCHDSYNS